MKAGAVLIIAGVWVLCQVLGGNALGRLGIAGKGSVPGAIPAGQAAGAVGAAGAGGLQAGARLLAGR